MRGIRYVGRDTGNLTDEELLYIHKEIIGAAWPALRAREIFEIEPVSSVGYRSIRKYTETDMGEALISLEGESINLDRTQLEAGTDVHLPVIHKEFTINWRDLEANRPFAESLDLREARNAARQVAEVENRLCFSGESTLWRVWGILGLMLAVPATQDNAGGAWPANAIANINVAIGELESSGFNPPYVLLAPVAQIRKLHVQLGAGGAGMTYYKFLLENNILQGIIADDSVIATDDGVDSAIVCAPGKDNFSLMVARDVTVHTAPLPNMNLFGRVYEVAVPLIKRPYALAEINTIT